MRVALDTNFIIDIFRFNIALEELYDLRPEISLCTTRQVMNEVRNIAAKRTRDAKFAKVALQFLEKSASLVEVDAKNADESLLKISKYDTIVATNDSELRKKLRKSGVKTIYLRARKHLAID